MNQKTLAAITKHGQSLLRAFPSAIEQDPIAICKKLRRIEVAVSKPILDYCNGDNGVTVEQLDAATDKALLRAKTLLGLSAHHNPSEPQLFINRDPRGSALKIDDVWTRDYNDRQYMSGKTAQSIYTDIGGYGILAPDLNQ